MTSAYALRPDEDTTSVSEEEEVVTPNPEEVPEVPSEEPDDASSSDGGFDDYVDDTPSAETEEPDVSPEPEPIEEEQVLEITETEQEPEVAQPEQPEPAQSPNEEQPNELEPQLVEFVEPEVSPSTQIEEERQAAIPEEEPELPEPVQDFIDTIGINPIVDEDSQNTVLEDYSDAAGVLAVYGDEAEAEARAGQNEDSLARGPLARLGDAAEIVTDTPAEVVDAVDGAMDLAGDVVQGVTDPLQQFVDGREQAALNERAYELDEEEKARLEAEGQVIEAALDIPIEDRVQPIAQALGLAEDTPTDQVIDELNNQLAQSGIKIEGTLDSFTLTEVPTTESELAEQISLALTLPPEEREAELERLKQQVISGTEFVANLVSQDFYNLLKHTTELQFNELPRIEQLKNQAGFDNSYIRENTAQYIQELKDLQKLTAEDIEQQIQGYRTHLTEEEANKAADQLKAKKEYADALEELKTKTQDLQQEAQITGALALVGFVPVDQLAAPAIRRVAQGVESKTGLLSRASELAGEARDFINGLFGRKTSEGGRAAVEAALKNADIAFAIPENPNPQQMFGTEVLEGEAPLLRLDQYPTDILQATEDTWTRIFGNKPISENVATLQKEVIAQWLQYGAGPTKIEEATQLAVETYSYYVTHNFDLKDASPAIQKAWSALRYDSRFSSPSGITTLVEPHTPAAEVAASLVTDITDALLRQQEGARYLRPVLTETEGILKQLESFATSNGASAFPFRNIDAVPDSTSIHIVSDQALVRLYKPTNAAGFFEGNTNQVVLKAGYQDQVNVVLHECIHKACRLGRFDPESKIQALLTDLKGAENYKKLNEGLTEWTTRKGLQLSGKTIPVSVYQPQVEAVEKIVQTIQRNSGIPKERAEAKVIETIFSGSFSNLYEPLGTARTFTDPFGKFRRERGQQVLIDILNKTPSTSSNVIDSVSRVVTPKDVALATGTVVGTVGAAGSGVYIYNEFRNDRPAVTPEIEIKRLPWNPVKSVYASNGNSNKGDPAYQTLDLAIKVRLTRNALNEGGGLDREYFRNVARTRVFQQEVIRTANGFTFVTGEGGSAEGKLPIGKYLVNVPMLANADVSVPQSVKVSDKAVTISVGIREGSGKIKKVKADANNSLAVYAVEPEGKQNVEVVTYYDKNGNGKWDGNEHSVPWAGVQVELKKVNQDKLISLLPGWNLLTLTAVPSKPLTASGFVAEIARQEGYATTVSTLENGSWKSFVQRGDKKFTGEDFAIEPGKAYFVKALKRSVFLYQGQEFVEPLKLSLNSGWNAVGFPKTTSVHKIGDLFDKVRPLFAEGYKGARWESGLWDTFVKKIQEEYGENFPIENNRGYILRVDRKTEFIP